MQVYLDNCANKTVNKCIICQYFFFKHGLRFQNYICNSGHDLTVLSVNISDIAIITVKIVDYRCIIHSISKSEAINLSKNSDFKDRSCM